jgi:hypothetical protein
MRNRNLAGVADSTANMFVRVELAKAGISAFFVERRCEREVKSTIVGFMYFDNGLMVSFDRAWYYWVVKLSRPVDFEAASKFNCTWAPEVRVDGFAGGTEPAKSGVSSYHVDSQEGLNALVQFLIELNGNPKAGLPMGDYESESVIAFKQFEAATLNNYPGMSFHPAPSTTTALVELEIAALLLLGGDSEHIVNNHKEAINLAARFCGPKSERLRGLRCELATVLRSQIRYKAAYYIGGSTDRQVTESYIQGCDLHDLLTMRMKLLRQVGRYKEAQAVKAYRDNQIAPQLVVDIRAYAKQLESSKSSPGQTDSVNYRRAFATWRLGMVQRTWGNHELANQLLKEARQLARKLSPDSLARYNQYTKAA